MGPPCTVIYSRGNRNDLSIVVDASESPQAFVDPYRLFPCIHHNAVYAQISLGGLRCSLSSSGRLERRNSAPQGRWAVVGQSLSTFGQIRVY